MTNSTRQGIGTRVKTEPQIELPTVPGSGKIEVLINPRGHLQLRVCTLPDELMYVVGSACARISDNSSPRAWYKLFTPTRDCELGLNEAQLLANHEQYGLALLRLFKELEREIDRLVGGTSSGTANRLLDTLKNRGYVTEWEFHFLNGIRALRNEFSHGRSSEPTEEESRMIYALNDGVILLASFLLAKLNSLGR